MEGINIPVNKKDRKIDSDLAEMENVVLRAKFYIDNRCVQHSGIK